VKVEVDRALCQNLGICASLVPAVFELQDDGTMVVITPEFDENLRASVESAVYACPTEALRIVE
jgi:ferredoxin